MEQLAPAASFLRQPITSLTALNKAVVGLVRAPVGLTWEQLYQITLQIEEEQQENSQ